MGIHAELGIALQTKSFLLEKQDIRIPISCGEGAKPITYSIQDLGQRKRTFA